MPRRSELCIPVCAQVTLIIYLGALIAFVGWFLFVIYVGIGMVALPMDCFRCAWCTPACVYNCSQH